MPNSNDVIWFKNEFGARIQEALAGTLYDLDFITAIACQESGEIWPTMRRQGVPTATIVELCVGDTLDGRTKTFPKGAGSEGAATLRRAPWGEAMFNLAHSVLVQMAQYVKGYQGVARNPNKFCHGFGVFQYDIQFFLEDPNYFLNKDYADFDKCLAHCIGELNSKLSRADLLGKTSLTDAEMVHLAIAYNSGSYIPAMGLRQGHQNGEGQFYGELINSYLKLCRATPGGPGAAPQAAPAGQTLLPLPTPVGASGPTYVVVVHSDPLMLRSEPKRDPADPKRYVIGRLPSGQVVHSTGEAPVNGYLHVETLLSGALLRGYASAQFLVQQGPAPAAKATVAATAPVVAPAAAAVAPAAAPAAAAPAAPPPTSPPGLKAVYMPHKAGSVTHRTDPPGAHSLNEPGQPGRAGATPQQRCAELGAIIDWLAVDRPANRRYQPTSKSTFCNVYAHDYCTLAGVYLPRVWWTPGALVRIGRGEVLPPLYDDTIEEVRANNLFRWLRDFGETFGWRRTGTLDKLQAHADDGGVAVIVARRVQDGASGHIVAVPPQTPAHQAQRNAAGVITAPLQSQAGRSNFRYGYGSPQWWTGAQFAEAGFFIHG